MKQVEGEREIVQCEEAVGPTEKVARTRVLGTLKRGSRRRQLPPLEVEIGLRRDLQKRVLTIDRIIALEYVLIKRIEPAPGEIRVILKDRVPIAVAVPVGVADPPSILDRGEVARLLFLGGKHARRPGISDRRVHRRFDEYPWLVKLVGDCRGRLRVDRTAQHGRAGRRRSRRSELRVPSRPAAQRLSIKKSRRRIVGLWFRFPLFPGQR